MWFIYAVQTEFERIFKAMAVDDRLNKDKMMSFFENAGLFPTQKEINGAFNSAFTGLFLNLSTSFN